MILGTRNGFVGPIGSATLIQSQTEMGPEKGIARQYWVGQHGDTLLMVNGAGRMLISHFCGRT